MACSVSTRIASSSQRWVNGLAVCRSRGGWSSPCHCGSSTIRERIAPVAFLGKIQNENENLSSKLKSPRSPASTQSLAVEVEPFADFAGCVAGGLLRETSTRAGRVSPRSGDQSGIVSRWTDFSQRRCAAAAASRNESSCFSAFFTRRSSSASCFTCSGVGCFDQGWRVAVLDRLAASRGRC